MTTISSDSELMTQYVSALAVPPSSYFTAVVDGQGRPMIFSLGTDKKFHLIVDDAVGNHILVDFGAAIGHSGNVHSFDVKQDAAGLIYVVAAVSGTTTSASDIVVLKPFNPVDYDLTQDQLTSLVIPHGAQTNAFTVTKMTLASTTLGTTPAKFEDPVRLIYM